MRYAAIRWTHVVFLLAGMLAGGALSFTTVAQAQEKPAESPPAARQKFVDAGNFQNNGAFDLAVDEWQAFLKAYPTDPLAGKARYYLGVCLLQQKKPEEALAAFEKVLADYPKFEQMEDLLVNLGSCQYSLGQAGKAEMFGKAATSYAKLAKDFPKSKFVEESLFYQGESLYSAGKKGESLAPYEQLIKDFPKSTRREETLYALGCTQEELGKYEPALATFETLLKEFPESKLATEVTMRKAEALLQKGDLAAAEKLFGEVAAVKGFSQADYALLRQGTALAKQEKFPEAAAVLVKLVTDFGSSAYVADATLGAARYFYRANNDAEAETWLKKVVEAKTPAAAEAAHWLARLYIKTGKPADAEKAAKDALAAGGDSPYLVNLLLDQADALFEISERRAESLPLFLKFAADHASHEQAPLALYSAAFTALDLKKFDEALKHAADFEKAYATAPLLPDTKYVAAEANLQLGKLPEAEAAYRELVEKFASHAEADTWKIRLARTLLLEKKYDDLVTTVTPQITTLKKHELVAEAHFLVGSAQFFADKFKEAETSLNASLAADPKWRQADETMLLVARTQRKLDQVDAAKSTLQKLMTDFASSTVLDQAHYRMGEILYAANDFAGSATEYSVVVTKYPESPFAPYALYGQGWSLLKSKEFAKAVESFTSVIDKHASHELVADSQYGRAVARRQAGDAAGSLADFDAYLKKELTPDQKCDALYERGLAQVAIMKYADAVASFDELLKVNAKYSAADKVLYELAWAQKSLDKHAEAVPLFEKIAKDYPESPLAAEAWFRVGEDQYEKKTYDVAVKSYTEAMGKKPAGELGEMTSYKLGWANFQLKQYQPALDSFSSQVKDHPAGPLSADGIFMKAECLFRMENYKDAYPAYEAASKTKFSSPTYEMLTLLHGGQSAAQLSKWDDALKLLSQIPAKFADSPLLPEATYEIGWAKQNLGKLDEALVDYEAAASASRDQVGARARFMRGEIMFERREHDAAIKEFQRAMFGYGGDAAAPEVKNWQARSGFDAGRCAEVQIMGAADAAAKAKAIAEAKRLYTYVVEKHPQHELAAEAKKRLAALEKL
ncbi:Tetratricopeptide TPR_2 repeat protein [Pirellula staleyi DSM 6068]|uniref:Tetratricopeptide TPR_2 repeat protein n=1 Tax=Pirellula staleyi (strain ATCC 27377 / DSM 6068 / ICPB 4128) TaxID=530564 RepID=D2R8K5_PIRSD|nr:tetratricopeptide repeat protein [Pirellula staleyi]ADB17546.1 Tetratricopeptide TPR_2 repeat protein [Pirellula staleyi DSM 6068]